jgi:hypothetical protein
MKIIHGDGYSPKELQDMIVRVGEREMEGVREKKRGRERARGREGVEEEIARIVLCMHTRVESVS